MTLFNKTIIFDQKRRLSGVSLFFLGALMFCNTVYSTHRYEGISEAGRAYTLAMEPIVYLGIVFMSVVIAFASIGFREKTERHYFSLTPIKKESITLTKLMCSFIASAGPILISFLVESVMYFINRKACLEYGFNFSMVFKIYFSALLISLCVISIIYLVSTMFSNAKLGISLMIAGILTAFYSTVMIIDGFVDFRMSRGILNIFEVIVLKALELPTNGMFLLLNSTGYFLMYTGVIILSVSIIYYVSKKSSYDVYENVFPFKISKVLGVISLMFVCMFIVIVGINIISEVFIFNRHNLYENTYETTRTIISIIAIVLTPAYFIISKKIIKKLEERF